VQFVGMMNNETEQLMKQVAIGRKNWLFLGSVAAGERMTVILRHPNWEACLADLRRNEALRRLIGIESEKAVPRKWNLSRFLEVLGEEPHFTRVRAIFDVLIQRLGLVVEDLGKDTAGDATALHAQGKRNPEAAKAEEAAGLPQPSGGKKEYFDAEGKVTKVFEWFGYKLHLIVDVKHEVALAWEITTATDSDAQTLPKTLKQAQANLPEDRIETLAFDKAADDHQTHKLLNRSGIKPLIEMRSLWKEEPLRLRATHTPSFTTKHSTQCIPVYFVDSLRCLPLLLLS
jgi:hypothetical protein